MAKRRIIFIFVFFGLLLFPFAFNWLKADTLGQSQGFFVDDSFDALARKEIPVTLRKISANAYWYAEDALWNNLASGAQNDFTAAVDNLAAEFDNRICPKLREFFGPEWSPGIDSDPKVTILFENIKSEAGGYFSPNDEYRKNEIVEGRSNEREMIYLNGNHLSNVRMKGYLAHEFQHLITFNQKERIRNVQEDVWLNELRSEYAETYLGYDDAFLGSNLEKRKADFLADPSDSLTEWRNKKPDYANVNLFGQYLAERFGAAVMTKMMQSDKIGIASLDEALAGFDGSLRLSLVFGDWLTAVFLNDCAASPKFCYQNPDLKDLKVPPTRIFSPTENSVIGLSQETKDWAGRWYRFDPWPGVLKFSLSGSGNNLRLAIPYAVTDPSGKIGIGEVAVKPSANNAGEEGTVLISNASSSSSSAVFIPFNQFKTTDFSDNDPVLSFSISVEVMPAESAPAPGPVLSAAAEPTPGISPLSSPPAQTATPSPAPVKNPKFTRSLYRGLRHPEVSALQSALRTDPEIYPAGKVTGYFGTLTETAVRRFQCKYGIVCYGTPGTTGYGRVGPMTLKKINEIYNR